MKRSLVAAIIICLILSFCGCTASPPDAAISLGEPSSSVTAVQSAANKEYEYVTDNDNTYYPEGNKLYKKNSGGTSLISEESMAIFGLQIHNGRLYYCIKNYDDCAFEVKVLSNGKAPKTVITNSQLPLDADDDLHSWQIYGDKLYLQFNFAFYSYDLQTGVIKRLHEDIAQYQFYDNNLYFIDHASRTFTIYRMDLGDLTTQIVLGDGVYKPDGEETVYSAFVINNAGQLFYAKRAPYGLYLYNEHGEDKLIATEDEGYYEYSMICSGKYLYYVRGQKGAYSLIRYNPKTDEKEMVGHPSGYGPAITIRDGYYFYKDYSEKMAVLKVKIEE